MNKCGVPTCTVHGPIVVEYVYDRLDPDYDEPLPSEMPTLAEALVFAGIVAVVLLACIIGIQP